MTAKKPSKIKNNVKGKSKNDSAKATLAVVTIIVQAVIILLLVVALTMPRSCAEKNDLANNVRSALQGSKKTAQKRYANALKSDHVMGNQYSKATIIMYIDMQCPACAKMMPHYRVVYEKYKGKAKFILRYFVIQGHDYARAAAIAVEAAGKQGYYWEMLNKTFENRGDWAYVNSEERLNQRLAEVFEDASSKKGNKEQFLSDLNDANLAKKVDEDNNIGRKDNIDATPTIIVNGEDINFSQSNLDVKELMGQKIEKALE